MMSENHLTILEPPVSLSRKRELSIIAKEVCRDLRRRSAKAEKLLWQQLRNRQFMEKKFRRQHPLFHDILGRETFYIPDFYCHDVRLAVELDGKIHLKQRERDRIRKEIINLLGITVLRFKNEEVENNMDGVLRTLRSAIESLSV